LGPADRVLPAWERNTDAVWVSRRKRSAKLQIHGVDRDWRCPS
jgi:hypothetical protein